MGKKRALAAMGAAAFLFGATFVVISRPSMRSAWLSKSLLPKQEDDPSRKAKAVTPAHWVTWYESV